MSCEKSGIFIRNTNQLEFKMKLIQHTTSELITLHTDNCQKKQRLVKNVSVSSNRHLITIIKSFIIKKFIPNKTVVINQLSKWCLICPTILIFFFWKVFKIGAILIWTISFSCVCLLFTLAAFDKLNAEQCRSSDVKCARWRTLSHRFWYYYCIHTCQTKG